MGIFLVSFFSVHHKGNPLCAQDCTAQMIDQLDATVISILELIINAIYKKWNYKQ